MNIFLVLSNFPIRDGEAVEVVSYEVLRFMHAAGNRVDVQVLLRDDPDAHQAEKEIKVRAEFHDMRGIEVLPAIHLAADRMHYTERGKRLRRLSTCVRSLPGVRRIPNASLFPAIHARKQVERIVRTRQADIIASIWSWEALAATYAIRGVPKFVYYGNPDHKPMEARLGHPMLYDIPIGGLKNTLSLRLMKMVNRAREIQHVSMMHGCEATANNSPIDAQYYAATGHPNSLYIRNMWPEATAEPLYGGRCAGGGRIRIVGSVGNMGATGNTAGLQFLGEHLAPRLERLLGEDALEIEIYGGGSPSKAVSEVLKRPSIRVNGWVKDIESEIKNACAFLVVTNASGFIVGNTRILLAWSLGACVIAHANSALSMPEIKHMENALLGANADEIARQIELAVADRDLREKIGKGGFDTYQRYFRPEVVVPEIMEAMEKCVHASRGRGNGK